MNNRIYTTAFIFSLFCLSINLQSQNWEWEILAPMPEARSNNAVAGAKINAQPYVYSFAGIDTSKIWSGIANKAFRYSVSENVWDTIPNLPMDIPVIAASANTIKNKIYIVGGYTVLENDNEISSDQVFEYNPETNTYEEKSNIPVAIDDQVQCVYKDSLLYVITGWSNTTNVANVQIYDPSNDAWSVGTSVPNNSDYKVFGGSGTIIGDTIYYEGGTGIVGNFNPSFQLVPFLRKGAINPENPTEITWSIEENDLALGYRMAAIDHLGKALWLGGSLVSYNYNGNAYNGSGGVPPTDRIVSYDPNLGTLIETNGAIPPSMDFRGMARIAPNAFILTGGMGSNQTVTNQCFILRDIDLILDAIEQVENMNADLFISPNPAKDFIQITLPENNMQIAVSDANGKILLETFASTNKTEIDINALPRGLYSLQAFNKNQRVTKNFSKE